MLLLRVWEALCVFFLICECRCCVFSFPGVSGLVGWGGCLLV